MDLRARLDVLEVEAVARKAHKENRAEALAAEDLD